MRRSRGKDSKRREVEVEKKEVEEGRTKGKVEKG